MKTRLVSMIKLCELPHGKTTSSKAYRFFIKKKAVVGAHADGMQAYFQKQGKEEAKKQGDAGTEHEKAHVFRNEAVVFEIEKNADIKQTCNDEWADSFFFIRIWMESISLRPFIKKMATPGKQNGRGEQRKNNEEGRVPIREIQKNRIYPNRPAAKNKLPETEDEKDRKKNLRPVSCWKD